MTTATLEQSAAPTEHRVWTLGVDRCDRDGAQAFALFTKNGQELMFCNHHRKRHEEALVSSGWQLHMNPEWEAIVNTKPSV